MGFYTHALDYSDRQEPDAGTRMVRDRPPLTVQEVGKEIRRLRTMRGLTLEKLARDARVSAGLLSQIERGRGNPSFNTLVNVAHALGTSIARLVAGEQRVSPVVRKDERRRLGVSAATGSGASMVAELLNLRPDSLLEVIRIEAPPGYTTEETPYSHEGEEFGLVLEGVHAVTVGGSRYVLEAGDSISYNSEIPHWYENVGEARSVSLWVVTPPSF